MRKWILLVLGAGLLMGANARAELGVFGSWWSPKDGDNTFGAGAKLRGGMGPFYLSLRGTYFDNINENVGSGADLRVIPADLGIGLQMDLLSTVQIYGGGGGTYYFMDVKQGSMDDEVGWYLEAGTELTITEHVSVFGEAMWRHVEGTVTDHTIVTDHADVNLQGVGINAGLVFR